METFADRLKTFANWPVLDYPVAPRVLADAGFFWIGEGDAVHCAKCKLTVYEWKAEDDAWKIHASRYPTCNFVKSVKGAAFVKQHQEMEFVSGVPWPLGVTAMKRFCKAAGLRFNYSKLVKGSVTYKDSVDKMLALLHKAGLEGNPDIKKCKALKKNKNRKRKVQRKQASEQGGQDREQSGQDREQCGQEREQDGQEAEQVEQEREQGGQETKQVGQETGQRGQERDQCGKKAKEAGDSLAGSERASQVQQRDESLIGSGLREQTTATPEEPDQPGSDESCPRMRPLAERLQTFANWPKDSLTAATELAEAGFIWTGKDDVVHCTECNFKVHDWWLPGPGAWVQHAYRYPPCNFVTKEKGAEFITHHQEAKRRNTIHEMMEFCKAAGLEIKDNLFEGCVVYHERVDKMMALLRDVGLEGKPTMKACSEIKEEQNIIKSWREYHARKAEERTRRAEQREKNKLQEENRRRQGKDHCERMNEQRGQEREQSEQETAQRGQERGSQGQGEKSGLEIKQRGKKKKQHGQEREQLEQESESHMQEREQGELERKQREKKRKRRGQQKEQHEEEREQHEQDTGSHGQEQEQSGEGRKQRGKKRKQRGQEREQSELETEQDEQEWEQRGRKRQAERTSQVQVKCHCGSKTSDCDVQNRGSIAPESLIVRARNCINAAEEHLVKFGANSPVEVAIPKKRQAGQTATVPAKKAKVNCEDRNENFNYKGSPTKHRNTCVKDEASPQSMRSNCIVCGKSYSRMYYLQAHIMTEHGSGRINKILKQDVWNCEKCGRNFNNKGSLTKHRVTCGENKASPNNMGNDCEICGTTLANKSNLQRHIKTKHESENVSKIPEELFWSCDVCGVILKDQSSLAKHRITCLKSLASTRINCTQCGKCFSSESFLRKHVSTEHENGDNNRNLNVSPTCERCGDICEIESSFKEHQKTCGNDEATRNTQRVSHLDAPSDGAQCSTAPQRWCSEKGAYRDADLEKRSLNEAEKRSLNENEKRSLNEAEKISLNESEKRSLNEAEKRSLNESEIRSLNETDTAEDQTNVDPQRKCENIQESPENKQPHHNCKLCLNLKESDDIEKHYLNEHKVRDPSSILCTDHRTFLVATAENQQRGNDAWFTIQVEKAKDRYTDDICRLCDNDHSEVSTSLQDHYVNEHAVDLDFMCAVRHLVREEGVINIAKARTSLKLDKVVLQLKNRKSLATD